MLFRSTSQVRFDTECRHPKFASPLHSQPYYMTHISNRTLDHCFVSECKTCKYCKSGKTNLCGLIRGTQGKGVMPDGTSRFTHIESNKPIFHYMGTSTLVEYTVICEISCAVVSEKAPLEKVCLLGCGITTGYGAAINTAHVEKGSCVVVFGLGGVGTSVVQGAKACGAARIIGVDMNEDKFEFAKLMGCTEFLNPKDHPDR